MNQRRTYALGTDCLPMIKPLFIGLLLIGSFCASAVETQTPDPEELKQVVKDCRTEGEAVGFSGEELKQFVEDCARDLLGATLVNIVK